MEARLEILQDCRHDHTKAAGLQQLLQVLSQPPQQLRLKLGSWLVLVLQDKSHCDVHLKFDAGLLSMDKESFQSRETSAHWACSVVIVAIVYGCFMSAAAEQSDAFSVLLSPGISDYTCPV